MPPQRYGWSQPARDWRERTVRQGGGIKRVINQAQAAHAAQSAQPAPPPVPNPNGYIDPNTNQYVPGTTTAAATTPPPAPTAPAPQAGYNGYIDPNTNQYVAPGVAGAGDNGYIDPVTNQYVPGGMGPNPNAGTAPQVMSNRTVNRNQGNPQPRNQGYTNKVRGNSYNELAAEYARRKNRGWAGNQFMENHPGFAANYRQNQYGSDRNRYLMGNGGGGQGFPKAPAQQQTGTGQVVDEVLAQAGVTAAGEPNNPNPDMGLPVSPSFIAAQRALEDELAAELAAAGIERAQIPAMVEQMRARMETDHGLAMEGVDEAANARGIYHSGIRSRDRERGSIPFTRNWQDFQQATAQKYADLSQRELGARSRYSRGLQEALLSNAGYWYDNPNNGAIAAAPGKHPSSQKDSKPSPRRGKRNRNGRGRRRNG